MRESGAGCSGYSGGRTDPYTPAYYGPVNDVHTPLFEAQPPPRVVHSPRVITPHQASTGTYSPYMCGRFALDCTGVHPAAQHSGSGGFNLLSWAWHGIDSGYHAVSRWAETPARMINAEFVTGLFNLAYGFTKVLAGVTLLTVGTAADLTGIGALLGLPVDVFGGYQLVTGFARIYRGATQFSTAISQPIVTTTPVNYFEGAALDVAPGGGILQKLGGLP